VHQIEKRSEKKKKKTLYLGSRRTEDENGSILRCDCNYWATLRDPCCSPCPPIPNYGGEARTAIPNNYGGGGRQRRRTARSCHR